jgi:hypothetical protein
MTPQYFWEIVGSPDESNRPELIDQRLDALSLDDLVGFRLAYDRLMAESFTVDLWGALHLLIPGCVDADFADFRSWLIEQGASLFRTLVKDPDSLADYLANQSRISFNAELNLDMVAIDLWINKTGKLEDDFFAAVDELDTEPMQLDESGDHWDFNDPNEYRSRLPKLSALLRPESA